MQGAVHIVDCHLELEAMEVAKAFGVRHFCLGRLGLRYRLPWMRFANVDHHEAYPISKAEVQLVEPRSGMIRHRACTGAENQQRRACVGEVAGSESASVHCREIELRSAIARAGVTVTEA